MTVDRYAENGVTVHDLGCAGRVTSGVTPATRERATAARQIYWVPKLPYQGAVTPDHGTL